MLAASKLDTPKTNGFHADPISPPPEFSSVVDDGSSSDDEGKKTRVKQYIYGDIPVENGSVHKEALLVEVTQKAVSQENIIEQEIKAQQDRERLMKTEETTRIDDEQRNGIEDNKNDNLQETLIEREIRLQREREEKVLQEREEAKRIAIAKGLSGSDIISNGHSSSSSSGDSSPALSPEYPITAEARIAMEIREQKAREEELKRLRELEEAPVSFTTTDEGHCSEYGQDDSSSSRLTSPELVTVTSHQRTQSLDSLSSGHSSSGTQHSYADFVIKRKVTVRPLEEPEEEGETPAYKRILGETVVEREIRLTQEREQELRLLRQSSNSALTVPKKKEVGRRSSGNKPDTTPDVRDIPHRLATHTIQREIWEQSEREQSMRKEGTIQSTSEEHVDDKVTRLRDLADMSKEQINEQTARKLTSSVSVTDVPSQQKLIIPPNHKPASRKISAPTYLTNGYSKSSTSGTPIPPVRVAAPSGTATRGLMQKFIANRGKMPSVGAFSPGSSATLPTRLTPVSAPPPPPASKVSPTVTPHVGKFEKNKTSSRPSRRFSTAEEKIQQELKDMKQRENELKQHRKLVLARSQPDLLAAVAAEERVADDEPDEVALPSLKPLRDRAMSNPSLLDDDDSDSVKQSSRPARRNPLIAKWESRIQQNIES